MNRWEKQIKIFESLGGTFCIPAREIKVKAAGVRGIFFDWDGVFHAGQKGREETGTFSEVDSMGINMLRYGYWRKHKRLPFIAIISGEADKTALKFATREHLDAIYTGVKDKKPALDHACAAADINLSQAAFVFDDISDLSIAKHSGLRIQIRRAASPLFMEYTKEKGLCDYITAHSARENGVREFSELMLALWENYAETIESRVAFDVDYQVYWNARNEKNTCYYSWEKDLGQLVESGEKGE